MSRSRINVGQRALKLLAMVIVMGGVHVHLRAEAKAGQDYEHEPDQTIGKKYGNDQLLRISGGAQWKRLLHYYRFFPWTSIYGEVDGEGFYLSSDGRSNPLAELKATLLAFERNDVVGKLKQPARCAFPERLRYLKTELDLAVTPPVKGDCKIYDGYIEKMNPQGVAIVFSSAFASNPGSMFGHTLLKINTGRKSDLLDRGVSFAASVAPGEGGLLYVVLGLMGGYPGQYSFLPYNEKVQEYINSESRDLWEYSLNFSPEESRRLVDHLWELESNSWFNYYFINKNCSYQLLTAIEVVKPDWDISSGWLWVVPAETVKSLIQIPGAVTQIRYRPSLQKRMTQSLDLLTPEERTDFEKLLDHKITPSEVNSPHLLSTTLQYIQYNRAESPGVDRKDLFALWDQSLERRSQLPSGGHIGEYQDPPFGHPEEGHGPIRMGLSQGAAQRMGGSWQGFEELHFKPAYHDLMNNDLGYPPFSEINFPNVTFRFYPQTGVFNLEQLQVLGMVSLVPLTFLEKRWSWKVNVEIQSPKDLVCDNCHVFHSEMAWGASVHLFSKKQIVYGLGGAYLDLGSGMAQPYRFGPELEIGLMSNPWQPYKVRIKSTVYGDVFQSDRAPGFTTLSLDQSLSFNSHWESRVEGRQVFPLFNQSFNSNNYSDLKISILYYF